MHNYTVLNIDSWMLERESPDIDFGRNRTRSLFHEAFLNISLVTPVNRKKGTFTHFTFHLILI